MQFPYFSARTFSGTVKLYLRLYAVVAIAAAMLLPVAAKAQFQASLTGVVTDTQGGIIPGATMALTNTATNETKNTVTNGAGVYMFGALPPAQFKLTVAAKGFQSQTIDNVRIIPEQANALNIHLALATVVSTVTVNAAQTPLMDTETPNIGGTISSNEVEHMPSFGRDVFQLTNLAAGTTGDQSQASGGGTFSLPGTQGPGGPSANTGIFATENGPQSLAAGQQYENNGISVDGISTASAVWGGTSVITPTEESVQSVRVVSNDYSAEVGRFSGEQIQVTSKSGTNTVHGSAFFQAWRPGLNAYQRYNGNPSAFYGPGTPSQRGLLKDTQDFNQMGGSVGGPIWKNHAFAFFAYETERNNSNVTGTGWYDTAAFDALAPSGSIASTYLSYPGNRVSSTGTINVTCAEIGLAEGTSCVAIPGQGLNIGSPLKTPLGTQDPSWTSPTSPGVGGGLNSTTADIAEYTTVNPTDVVDQQFNGRVDADAGSKDHVAFAIYWVPVTQSYYNSTDRTYNLWHHDAINDAFSGIWDHSFSSNLLNEARANAAGWRWNEVTTNSQAPFGLPQDSIGTIGSSTTIQSFGAGGPSDFDQWTYSFDDVATRTVDKHTIKFGGELTRLYYLNVNPTAARPGFGFFNVWDFLNDAPMSESGTFDPTSGLPTAGRQDNREDLWGFFVQDDWKATPNLTLNMGVRYSYFGPLDSKEGNLYKVQFGTGTNLLTGMSIQSGGGLWNPQHLNFGPQFGFTYSPDKWKQRFVVRGGYGLNYNQEEIAISSQSYFNPGLEVSPNFTMSLPSSPNPGIVYSIPSDVHSLYGYPPNPNTIVSFGANGLPTTGQVSVNAFSNNFKTMYTEHWSLDTETDLGYQFLLTVGYQGSVMRHLFFREDENAAASVEDIPLNPQVNSVIYWSNLAHGSYNAGLVELKHQLTHTFLLDGQFTWGKSMDNSSAPYEDQDYPYDTSLNWGRSDYDISKQGRVYGMWQPVIFHGSRSWAEKIAGGWSLSGVFNVHSGFPWTPVYDSTVGNLYCSTCPYTQVLPAAYLGGAGNDTSNDAFKSGPGVGSGANKNFPLAAANGNAYAYFAPPTLTAGPTFPATGGTAPAAPGIRRNSWTGPGYRDVDATVSKVFGMPYWKREGAGIEVRADAFNLFNNLNFNPTSIANNISSANFGQAGSALGSRTVTLQARFQF